MAIENLWLRQSSVQKTKSSTRNVSLDLLRIIACIMVILIHVSPDYTVGGSENFVALTIQSIVRTGLPIFFILSGYYALNNPIVSLKKFYINRMSSVIIPFIVYSYIHFLYVSLEFGIHASIYNIFNINTFYHFILNIIQGPNGSESGFSSKHFWFVYWIIGLYILTPAIRILLNTINERRSIYSIIILLGIQSYNLYAGNTPLISSYFYPIQLLPNLDIWLIYFMIGGFIYRIDTSNLKLTPLLLIALFYIVTIYLTIKNPTSRSQISNGVNMILLSMSVFILIRNVRINKFEKTIEYLSSKTYGIYLCHIFIYFMFKHRINEVINGVFLLPIVTSMIVFLLSLALTVIINYIVVDRLINKIKIS